MTSPLPAIVVADTGPLLCAGIIGKPAIDMLYQQLSGRIRVPRAVIVELENRVRRTGGPNSQARALSIAATRFTGTRASFIARDFTAYQRDQMRPLRAEITAAEQTRGAASGHDHNGEIEAILLAETHQAIVMTNDTAATTVAQNHGLTVVSFATVLAVEVRQGRLTGDEASTICHTIKPNTHPGTHRIDPLDFDRIVIPDGFRA